MTHALVWFLLGALALRIAQALMRFLDVSSPDEESATNSFPTPAPPREGLCGESLVRIHVDAPAPMHVIGREVFDSIEFPCIISLEESAKSKARYMLPDGKLRSGAYRVTLKYAMQLDREETP